MLPGRELINEIEKTLSDLDADEWELSVILEPYIIDNGDEFYMTGRKSNVIMQDKALKNI